MKRLFLQMSLMIGVWACVPVSTMAEQVVVQTKNTTMLLDVDKGKAPQYIYYGARLSEYELSHLQKPGAFGRMEAYPAHGMNTPAEAALAVRHADGNMSTALVAEYFEQGEVVDEGNFVTCITMKDPVYQTKVELNFKAYTDEDIIEVWTENGLQILQFTGVFALQALHDFFNFHSVVVLKGFLCQMTKCYFRCCKCRKNIGKFQGKRRIFFK